MSPGPPRAALVAGRVVLLAVAVVAIFAALAARREANVASAAPSAVQFSCPMHPEVRSQIGGDCPICNMALEIIRPAPPPPAQSLVLRPDETAIQSADVAPARRLHFSVPVSAPAWIDSDGGGWALLHRGDAQPGQAARFVPASGSSPAIDVHIARAAPQAWDSALIRVRFEVPEAREAATGWLNFGDLAFDVVSVPQSAVTEAVDGPHVFVASADRRSFARRKIETGRPLFGFATVLTGLREGERVVIANAFFLVAEQRLRSLLAAGTDVTP